MLHLMLHLRFHFNKHKKLQKNVKKMHLVSQLMVHFKMQCKGTPLNLKLGSLITFSFFEFLPRFGRFVVK